MGIRGSRNTHKVVQPLSSSFLCSPYCSLLQYSVFQSSPENFFPKAKTSHSSFKDALVRLTPYPLPAPDAHSPNPSSPLFPPVYPPCSETAVRSSGQHVFIALSSSRISTRLSALLLSCLKGLPCVCFSQISTYNIMLPSFLPLFASHALPNVHLESHVFKIARN